MFCLRIKHLAVKVPPSCRYLDLFSVVPSSTPRPRGINNQLVSLAPVEINNCIWYTCSWNISLFIINYSNRVFILSYYYHYVVSRNAPSSKQVLFTILKRDKLTTTVAEFYEKLCKTMLCKPFTGCLEWCDNLITWKFLVRMLWSSGWE